MTQPTPRERVELMIPTNRGSMTVWSPSEVQHALDAYRDDIAIDIGRNALRYGLQPFLTRLVGEANTRTLLAGHRAAALREAADAVDAEAATGNLNAPEYGSHENVLDASAHLRRMAEEARS